MKHLFAFITAMLVCFGVRAASPTLAGNNVFTGANSFQSTSVSFLHDFGNLNLDGSLVLNAANYINQDGSYSFGAGPQYSGDNSGNATISDSLVVGGISFASKAGTNAPVLFAPQFPTGAFGLGTGLTNASGIGYAATSNSFQTNVTIYSAGGTPALAIGTNAGTALVTVQNTASNRVMFDWHTAFQGDAANASNVWQLFATNNSTPSAQLMGNGAMTAKSLNLGGVTDAGAGNLSVAGVAQLGVTNTYADGTGGAQTHINQISVGGTGGGTGKFGIDFNTSGTDVGVNYSVSNTVGKIVRTAAIVFNGGATSGSEFGKINFFTTTNGATITSKASIDGSGLASFGNINTALLDAESGGAAHYMSSVVIGNTLVLQNTQSQGYTAIDYKASDTTKGIEQYGAATGYGNTNCNIAFRDGAFFEAYELRDNVSPPRPLRFIQTGTIGGVGTGNMVRQEFSTNGDIVFFTPAIAPAQIPNLTIKTNGNVLVAGTGTFTNGITSLATNYSATFGGANSTGITNSAVAPGVGGTNVIVANVKGTSGNIVFWNRTGAGGTTICGQSVWTNTVSTLGADYVVGVNCGIAIDTGVGVVIQTRAW